MKPSKVTAGGEVKIIDSKNFPLTPITTAIVRPKPGGLRELHWHPNADEWQYFIGGKGRMGVFAAGARARTMDFQAGDVGYVLQSQPHYIENTGDTDLVFLEMFDSSHYEDISLAEWIAHTPQQLIDQHLHVGTAMIECRSKRLDGDHPGVMRSRPPKRASFVGPRMPCSFYMASYSPRFNLAHGYEFASLVTYSKRKQSHIQRHQIVNSHRIFAATMAALFTLSGAAVFAQDRPQRDNQSRGQARDDNRAGQNGNNQNQENRFNEHDKQVARDWYGQHQNQPPAGLRSKDRLSPEQESRLNQGAVLDRSLRNKVHPAPQDLSRQLPPPQNGRRYVVIGGHVASIDNSYQVHDVIHLHDDHSNQRQH